MTEASHSVDQIKQDLDSFIQMELLDEPWPDLINEQDILTTDVIDSLGWMRVVEYVETTHGYRIPPEHVTIENFINLDTLSRYVSKNI